MGNFKSKLELQEFLGRNYVDDEAALKVSWL